MQESSAYDVRRSTPRDILSIRNIVSANTALYEARYGAGFNISALIEQSHLSITLVQPLRIGRSTDVVTQDDDNQDYVVGFIVLATTPPKHGQLSEVAKERWRILWDPQDLGKVSECQRVRSSGSSCNTLWLNFFCCAWSESTAEAAEALRRLLVTALATCPNVSNFLLMLPPNAEYASPIRNYFMRRPSMQLFGALESATDGDVALYLCTREQLTPRLRLRRGVVEDYDDLVPLLVSGVGTVTPLPSDLYLEELLLDEDRNRAVVVAEDPIKGTVVGLLCLTASLEVQECLVRQYALEPYAKLRRLNQPTGGGTSVLNIVQLTFLYLNPQYDGAVDQLLPHIFVLFPDVEYCVVMLPHAAEEHPVLSFFSYVPIRRFQPTGMDSERMPLPPGLWVCCRYGLEDIDVSCASQFDSSSEELLTELRPFQQLLKAQGELTSQYADQILQTIRDSMLLESGARTYALRWNEQVVGLAVSKRLTVREVYAIRYNFDVEKFVNFVPYADASYEASDFLLDGEAAREATYRDTMPILHLLHLYIRRPWRLRLRFFIGEVLRQSETQVVVHRAFPDADCFSPLLDDMNLVPSRRVVRNCDLTFNDGGWQELYCLYALSRKTLSDEKTRIHARIVVIGASTTGLAVLYSLLQLPFLHFSSLLLISPGGMPQYASSWRCDTMEWTEREYAILHVKGRVRVIDGQMTDFEKTDRYVYTIGGVCEPYDQLIIATGRQYALPRESSVMQRVRGDVVTLSSVTAPLQIERYLRELDATGMDTHIVVYGSSLDTFAAISSLLSLGVMPECVVLVTPRLDGPDSHGIAGPRMDQTATAKVQQLFSAAGVTWHRGYDLERLQYHEDGALSSIAVVDSCGDATELPCSLLLYAARKDIDPQVLTALNKRSIVFDGRVIIENNYRTTDANTYAVGPVAMFSLRFGQCDDFEEYNALEVGEHLSRVLLGFLNVEEYFEEHYHGGFDAAHAPKDDPLAAELGGISAVAKQAAGDAVVRERPPPLPRYERPVCRMVSLPGEHVFFTAQSIGFPSLREQCRVISSVTAGAVGTKDNPISNGRYIAIDVSPRGYMERVTYVGQRGVEWSHLVSLVGRPQSMLNLVYRYEEASKRGSYNLWKELQAAPLDAVYFDRFDTLFSNLQRRLARHPEVQRVAAELQQRATPLTEEDKTRFHRRLTQEPSEIRHLMELELIQMLQRHRSFLSAEYHVPDIGIYVPQFS